MPRASRASTAAARCARAVVVALVGAVACAAPALDPPPAGGTVVMASGADLESANPLVTTHPLSRQVQRHALFVTLVRHDSALRVVPYLARRWTWSPDRRALRLHLATGLRWHDGVPTTAHDVAFTLEAVRDPATGSPRAAALAWLARVEVQDDTTLTLHARTPLADVPGILGELPLAPRHRLAAVPRADLRRHPFAGAPVGNGPFRFRERRPGQRWVFDRVPDFPAALGGPARIGRLVIAVVDEATTKFAGLVGGDLDIAGINPTMASLVARDPLLRVLEYPVTYSYALVFNTTRPPFDDARVRRALGAAIDRARIVDVALAGFATP